jgi:hypothetical protein
MSISYTMIIIPSDIALLSLALVIKLASVYPSRTDGKLVQYNLTPIVLLRYPKDYQLLYNALHIEFFIYLECLQTTKEISSLVSCIAYIKQPIVPAY